MLILRRVRPMGGAVVDIACEDGVITAMAPRLLVKGPELDCGGHALIPGLIDHHIHLFATAARMESIDLAGLATEDAIIARLRGAADGWVRAIGYDEAAAGLPDRHVLDRWLPDHPLRLQDRTGALWMLNSRAIEAIGPGPFPAGVGLNDGKPTGHIWREDVWLRDRLAALPPSLTPLGQQLTRYGVTGVTDAGAGNGPVEAALLAKADMPQHRLLMGGADLPDGPLKLLFDERDLPEVATIAARITAARAQRRRVAAHCVTAAELVTYLAALEAAGGAQPGDRIEHGADIPLDLIAEIARLGLTVITQPAFIHDRGDRYLRDHDAVAQADLWRLQSLLQAGVKVAAGSDAPYGSPDPWRAIRAASTRQTATGQLMGGGERISAMAALSLYLGTFGDPGGVARSIAVGAAADLCLLRGSIDDCLSDPHHAMVQATLIAGKVEWHADN